MAITETSQRQRKKDSGRPAVWPYTATMALVGGLISVVFILGAMENLKEGNYPMGVPLATIAAAFIIIPPSFTHRLLSSEADRMTPRRRDEVRCPGVDQPRTVMETVASLKERTATGTEPQSTIGEPVSMFDDSATRTTR